jgi:hypothetical protein
VDARSAPKRVVAAHLPNQFSDFLRHCRASGLPAADLPSPEQPVCFAVPGNHGIRFHDVECRAPRGPGSTKPRPQHPVEPVQFRFLHGALQNAQLMAKREDLKLQCRSSSEKRQRCGKQCRQHGRRTELSASAQLPLYQPDPNLRETQSIIPCILGTPSNNLTLRELLTSRFPRPPELITPVC